MKINSLDEYFSLNLIALLGLSLFLHYLWWSLMILTPVEPGMAFFANYGIFEHVIGYLARFHIPFVLILFIVFIVEFLLYDGSDKVTVIPDHLPKNKAYISLFYFGIFISITPFLIYLVLYCVICLF